MNQAPLNKLALNSYPAAGSHTLTFSIDALTRKQYTVTHSIDAVLLATFRITHSIDAILQANNSKFFNIDAVLATPYKDGGALYEYIGNGLSIPVDLNAIGQWSTYSRPTITAYRPVVGFNKQTGKIEYWDHIAGAWKNADGTSV